MKKIDILNQQAWQCRYSNTSKALATSEEALDLSLKSKYAKGKAYARLNLGVCHFLRSENQQALELGIQLAENLDN